MKIILLALYILAAVPIVENQQGILRWLAAAFFAYLAWIARNVEKIAEEAEGERHEEILELLRDIKYRDSI